MTAPLLAHNGPVFDLVATEILTDAIITPMISAVVPIVVDVPVIHQTLILLVNVVFWLIMITLAPAFTLNEVPI